MLSAGMCLLLTASPTWGSARFSPGVGPEIAPGFAPQNVRSYRCLNILVRFSDSAAEQPYGPDRIERLFGDRFPGLGDYFRSMSYGRANLDGTRTVGWLNLGRPRAAYMRDERQGQFDTAKLIKESIERLPGDVNVRDFFCVNVFTNKSDEIDGAYFRTIEVELDGKPVPIKSTLIDPDVVSHDVLVHELGHAMGMDHCSGAYDETYDSQWDPMSGGRFKDAKLADFGEVAVGLNAFHRYQMEWLAPDRIVNVLPGERKTIRLARLTDPTTNEPVMARIFRPGQGSRWLTVEARLPHVYEVVGGKGLPAYGAIIHDVNLYRAARDPENPGARRPDRRSQVIDPDRNGNPNDAGAVFTAGESHTDAEDNLQISVQKVEPDGITIEVSVPTGLAPCGVVSNTSDKGAGSLREAIVFAATVPGWKVQFSATVPTVIPLLTPLPELARPGLTLEGPVDASGRPLITLDAGEMQTADPLGMPVGDEAVGLAITGPNVRVANLAVTRSPADGVLIRGSDARDIQLENVVMTAAKASGVVITDGAQQVRLLNCQSSGNGAFGVLARQVTGVTVRGGVYGLSADGTTRMKNGSAGMLVRFARDVTVEDATFSGNEHGGCTVTNSERVRVTNCRVGTTPDGSQKAGNGLSGLWFEDSCDVLAEGNRVAANGNSGIVVIGTKTADVVIRGGTVGLLANGTIAPSNDAGIAMQEASGVRVEGVQIGSAIRQGIDLIRACQQITIIGCRFGDVGTATSPPSVRQNGVVVREGCSAIRVEGCQFFGCERYGVNVAGPQTTQVQVLGCEFGAAPDAGKPTLARGVLLQAGASQCVIGRAEAPNRFWPKYGGVVVSDLESVGNCIRYNTFHEGVPIDLVQAGTLANPNDALDADTGPNELMNFPTIASAVVEAETVTVEGAIVGPPTTAVTVDLYGAERAVSYQTGPATQWLASIDVMTDSEGKAVWQWKGSIPATTSHVCATVTHATTRSTSEFGPSAPVVRRVYSRS
ncbi:MAG: right-handed parallel beta-helix repeat-containing protein [Fimbriimonadaceae bacterium]|nr:right-handed parallel beta-helix repeat-containing protein [Fimbriimonadaceae bacterium]